MSFVNALCFVMLLSVASSIQLSKSSTNSSNGSMLMVMNCEFEIKVPNYRQTEFAKSPALKIAPNSSNYKFLILNISDTNGGVIIRMRVTNTTLKNSDVTISISTLIRGEITLQLKESPITKCLTLAS